MMNEELIVSEVYTDGETQIYQLSLFPIPKYLRTTFEEDREVWEKTVGTKFRIDGWATAVFGKKVIDIVAMDNDLWLKYDPEYSKDGCCAKCSMMDFLSEKFGEDISFLIYKWTSI